MCNRRTAGASCWDMDPRTPVIVGVGQITQKLADNYQDALEPVKLMERAVRAAADDAGATSLLSSIERIIALGGLWSYEDPARQVADAVGSPDAASELTYFGGNTPQTVVGSVSQSILNREADVVVAVGGEAVYSRNKLKKAGGDFDFTRPEMAPATRFGKELKMSSEHEQSLGLMRPTIVYPMFESALRAQAGSTVDEHNAKIANLWKGFNEVAVANPNAWSQTPMTAEEIGAASESNRYVCWPYTKVMNANMYVDQSAAVIMCSVAKAEDMGIDPSRWVFPHSAADGHASVLFSERENYYENTALRVTGKQALNAAGVDIDQVEHFDLYSCFPSMPQISTRELGIDIDRQLTQTGGLGFFGGPMNNYVMHAIASMVDTLRANPGDLGLVHGNGGFATKQAVGIYGAEPPAQPFSWVDVQPEIDRVEITRPVNENPAGEATVESYVLPWSGDAPGEAVLTAINPDGSRSLARTEEPDVLAAMLTEEFVGRSVVLQPDNTAVFA